MTPFAKKVYRIVSEIHVGQTRTYKWVARQAGRAGACRAVGQILKKNPYPFIVPCHRVIKSNGGLGGYVFGKKIKRKMLKIEKEIAGNIINE